MKKIFKGLIITVLVLTAFVSVGFATAPVRVETAFAVTYQQGNRGEVIKTIQRKLNDSAFARWSALILISLMMFFAYMFVDMLSPLKELLDTTLNWDSSTFGPRHSLHTRP